MNKAGNFGFSGLCPILLCFPAAAATCDSLASLKLTNTSVTSAQIVAVGAFVPPGSAPKGAVVATYRSLPAFCRVQGVIQPATDSHIEFEVWLPATGWNGKYMGTGNGGFAGSIGYASAIDNVATLSSALLSGYAASATDTGHKGSATDAQWAMGHPEKVVDYGYRAIHETAEKSKTIIRAFYGVAPKHSYFSSCSNGGRQALMEAQRFPADYDGIIAGAPATSTNLLAKFALDALATEVDPASYIPQAKLPAIDAATLAACDALDGLKDGIIDDPRKCNFDPSTLLCKSAETDSCLTQPQVAALKKIYAAATNSKGERIYPGFLPGAETAGWGSWITGDAPGKSAQYAFATQGSAYMLFQNPAWDFRTFNIDRDPKIADDTFGQRFNATSPDLKALDSRGGKLILYHGWSDPALSPLATIDYYQSVIAKVGAKDAATFTRLYMVPGMQHCGGGPGPNNFGTPMLTALEQWVEQKKAPEAIIATHATNGKVDRIRPLCPYPQVAKYMGSGSIDEAANFACRMP
jgi:Tannase and feruloyl esterase